MYMSPLILLVLEPEIPGDADLAVGLATYCALGTAQQGECGVAVLGDRSYCTDWRYINMLDALLGLDRSVDSGSCRRCCTDQQPDSDGADLETYLPQQLGPEQVSFPLQLQQRFVSL